jgi:putative tricarboxylic transport membrane protein
MSEHATHPEHPAEESARSEPPRPKGEYKMMALLFVICLALFVDSLRSPGFFQGVSAGPGSIPQLVAGALVLMIVGLAVQFYRRGYREGSFADLLHHLFDREVVILLVTLTIYAFVIETIHFVPATFLFLVGTMWLLDPRKLLMKAIISGFTLAGLYLVFSTLFQVVLP